MHSLQDHHPPKTAYHSRVPSMASARSSDLERIGTLTMPTWMVDLPPCSSFCFSCSFSYCLVLSLKPWSSELGDSCSVEYCASLPDLTIQSIMSFEMHSFLSPWMESYWNLLLLLEATAISFHPNSMQLRPLA